jgi:hypothetical protein
MSTCPFCGSHIVSALQCEEDRRFYFVICCACGARGPLCDDGEGSWESPKPRHECYLNALEAWGRRVRPGQYLPPVARVSAFVAGWIQSRKER